MLSRAGCNRAIATALFLFILLPFLAGCPGKKPGEGRTNSPGVTVSIVEQKDTPAMFEYVGQTWSSHIVEIRARIDGFLDRVAYEEGFFVKKGQVLFEIDKKPFEIALEELQAEPA
jgi:membrane fusion protein, multidrug efflux system